MCIFYDVALLYTAAPPKKQPHKTTQIIQSVCKQAEDVNGLIW